MLRSDFCDYSDAYMKNKFMIYNQLHLKIMPHLDHIFQKLTVH